MAAVLLVVWGIAFGLLARDAPLRVRAQGDRGHARACSPASGWPGCSPLFYFLTFGGFVAFSIYLPTLLKDQFGLTPADAGFRAAGFVVLATLMRPLGGWLADRIGGARVLAGVFLGVVPFALLLAWPSMLPFTVGALGCAALLGIGNGAVFKLVPQYFPKETGTVTGLVGAMGGLGGFFPPLLLGFFRDRLGVRLAGLRAARGDVARPAPGSTARVFLPRQEALELRAARRSSRRAADRCAPAPGRRCGRRCSSPRSSSARATCRTSTGAGDLHVRRASSPPGAWPTTTRLAAEAADADVLARGAGSLLRQRGMLDEPRGDWSAQPGRTSSAQTFIRQRSRLRWWMHQLPLLGLPAGGGHHVPAGLRLDPLRQPARRTR